MVTMEEEREAPSYPIHDPYSSVHFLSQVMLGPNVPLDQGSHHGANLQSV